MVKKKLTYSQIITKFKEGLKEKYEKRKIKEKFERPSRAIKKFEKFMDKRAISRKVMRQQPRATLRIRETKQEPYRSIYFKNEFERERKKLFFT